MIPRAMRKQIRNPKVMRFPGYSDWVFPKQSFRHGGEVGHFPRIMVPAWVGGLN